MTNAERRSSCPTAGEHARTAVTVYSTGPSCQRCRLTCLRLDAVGIPYRIVEIAEDANAAAREYITAELGYTEAPVVIVNDDDQHHWSGFRPDLIDQLCNRGAER